MRTSLLRPKRPRGPFPRPLRVMWIWHAAVVAEYQKPLSALAACDALNVTLLVPRRWPERSGQMVVAEQPQIPNFRYLKGRTVFTGFYYIYFFPALLLYLLRYRPHIIYCYEEAHSFMAALTLALRRIFLPNSLVLLYAAQNIEKRYPVPFRLFEGYCFRRADAILACGESVADTLRSKGYRSDLRVVPLPVDTGAFSPRPDLRADTRRKLGVSEDAFLIGYAGKLVEEKGLRTLMQAFIELSAEYANVHLLMAGGGPLLREMRDMVAEVGLDSRLHAPGVVHNTDLPACMNACDTFVLPSETRRNWREQFGRVIVEAMSCGVPVIGSDSGEIPNVISDAGLSFHEGAPSELASCLRLLISQPDLRAELCRKGRARVLNLYSVEKVAASHQALYDELAPTR